MRKKILNKKCLTCNNIYEKTYFTSNNSFNRSKFCSRKCYHVSLIKTSSEKGKSPSHCKIYKAEHYALKAYGNSLSKEKILKLLNKRHTSICKICRKKSKSKKGLHIDHDHITGKVRDLLCFKCNIGLGYFNDDIKLLKNAIKYLQK